MSQKLIPTAGQTLGPFYGFSLPYVGGPELVPPHHPRAMLLAGTVYDGAGEPVPDALVEIWQPDENGDIPQRRGSLHRDGHTFTGFGRCATDPDGRYQFWTLTPGSLAASTSAPFFSLIVFARGLTDKLHSRIYLPSAADAAPDPIATDPLLSTLSAAEQASLIATREPDGSLHHDIHLQGEDETVFLDFG